CKVTEIGKEYKGHISQTNAFKTCQRWDSQTPNTHPSYNPNDFPEDTISEAANYCRNPNGQPQGPWCHTTDPSIKWQYCNVGFCECKTSSLGEQYRGQKTTTITGKTCQRWDQQYPHKHDRYNPAMFPDNSVAEAGNFCRNPDNSPRGPWCFTTDPSKEWEWCSVPVCEMYDLPTPPPPIIAPRDCKTSDMGTEYRGRKSWTKTGKQCQRWDSQTPHAHENYDANMFPDVSVADAGNFCRNPDLSHTGPWCYTIDPNTEWEYCDIDWCECKHSKLGSKYVGTIHSTVKGVPCQRWDSQSPHQHDRIDASKFPDATLGDAANYCRNPDGEPGGLWCYTSDPGQRWDYCDIPHCPCKQDYTGNKYEGTKQVTQLGFTCQRWDQQTPHSHPYRIPTYFPDRTMDDASNYCRNPNNDPVGPWCYTTNPAKEKDYCMIPFCSLFSTTETPPSTTPTIPQVTTPKYGPQEECKYSHMGKEYMGSFSKTSSGLNCQRWDSQFPHNHNN
ncbi:unnamed protein product, partial [Owenia fusiformis]